MDHRTYNENACFPVSISYIIHPSDHISVCGPYARLNNSSGLQCVTDERKENMKKSRLVRSYLKVIVINKLHDIKIELIRSIKDEI